MKVRFGWFLVATTVLLAVAYGSIRVNQRLADTRRDTAAAIADQARREAQSRFVVLCRGSNSGRREVNRISRDLSAYLGKALQLNAKAEKLQPAPVVLKPLVDQELAAARRLRRQLRGVPLTRCTTRQSD